MFHEYGVEAGGEVAKTFQIQLNSQLYEVRKTDWAGRTRERRTPGRDSHDLVEGYEYDDANGGTGRLLRVTRRAKTSADVEDVPSRLASQITGYDAWGRVTVSGLDVTGDEALSPPSANVPEPDQYVETATVYEKSGGATARVLPTLVRRRKP